MKHLARPYLLVSCLALLAGAPAFGWEGVYGPAASTEGAARKVTPVPACGAVPAGYIAVGTQDPGAAGNADVYVVRTNVMGNPAAPAWEATYDVQGLGQRDEGVAIVPAPGGYVFLSNVWNGAVWRPALTMINCQGNVMWSQLYVDMLIGQSLRGSDLIRTQTGNPTIAPPTNAGDFAVSGVWFNGADEDAFLMRTNAVGALIWSIAHNTGLNEAFNSLAEALPVAPELAGDLVAVGRFKTTAGDLQALVARVNGNNGVIGAAPQCMQHHGGTGIAEVYNSVKRLVNFFPGQFIFAGTITNNTAAGWADDVWVTRGNTCGLTAQARFGNSGGVTTTERGNDIIEVLVAKPGAPVGSLAIAGDHKGAAGLGYEAALMLLNPGLATLAGQHRLFGDFGPNVESFNSLAEDPAGWPVPPGAGYILAGITRTPWIVADPQDLYLVHDDPALIACEQVWSPTRVTTGFPQANLTPQWRRPAANTAVPTPRVFQLTGQQICAP